MQIKILSKKIIVFSVLILTLFLVYFFSRGALWRMEADTLYWQGQSSLTKNLLPKLKSEQELINLLNQRTHVSHRGMMLAPTEQNILQLVKDYAQRMNIRVVNIATDAERVFFDSRPVSTFTVAIEAKARYENLVRYFDTLGRVAPAYFSVEWLKIDKNKTNPDKLKVFMELRFYSLL